MVVKIAVVVVPEVLLNTSSVITYYVVCSRTIVFIVLVVISISITYNNSTQCE